MPLTVACPSCSTKLRVRDELVGRKVKCPKCNSVIDVADESPPVVEDVKEILPRRPTADGVNGGESQSPKRQAREQDETDDDERRARRRGIDDFDEEDEDFDDEPRKKKKKGQSGRKVNRKDLRDIATYQRAVLLCILVSIIAVGSQFALPPSLRLFLALGMLVTSVVSSVFVFLLAVKVYSLGVGIALALVTLIPCIGLIALLIINAKATSTLKENGIRVGLMGAKMSDFN
jgi:predicted Zn finger-like uncharacterized protein